MKVLCVFGTRPEAIKMAPVVQALRRRPGIQTRVCVTAQHRQMLDQVLEVFGIVPDHDLNLMKANQTLADLTASVLSGMDRVLEEERPDWVLVQGDTTTVMAASLAAFYRRIRVGHVEAGLRSGNKHHPFPEEINRRVADVVCDAHFAPTEAAGDNLRREGVSEESIHVTGNTVIDALHWAVKQPAVPEIESLLERIRGGNSQSTSRIILVTAHRRENFGAPFEAICGALREIARRYPDVHLVYPVHLNPNAHDVAHRILRDAPNITLLPPLDYLPLVQLMQASYLVLTDSGGLQEEAPGLRKPVLVLREVTERPEGVAAGVVRLVGADAARIVTETARLLDDPAAYATMARGANPYGDGRAADRIVEALERTP